MKYDGSSVQINPTVQSFGERMIKKDDEEEQVSITLTRRICLEALREPSMQQVNYRCEAHPKQCRECAKSSDYIVNGQHFKLKLTSMKGISVPPFYFCFVLVFVLLWFHKITYSHSKWIE